MSSARRTQILIRLSYHGDAFHGVPSQGELPTVESALRRRLVRAFAEEPRALTFTSRTDAGVDARVNYATCWFRHVDNADAAIKRVRSAENDGLDHTRAWIVPRQVFARTLAATKVYRYVFEAGCPADELLADAALGGPARCAKKIREQIWQIAPSLAVDAMQRAALAVVGTHDFSSFRVRGCRARDPTKTLVRATVDQVGTSPTQRQRVAVTVEGTGFLRKMVRIIAGTLAEIGAGLRPPEAMAAILRARDRRQAGVVAPARGLTLAAIRISERIAPLLAALETQPITMYSAGWSFHRD